ncbi:AP-3 complex subunit delta-1 [Oryzias melastigma]|uniref:AP-3 complex subunit delta-1 n=1 Tax=Oryzias melastigma TaxID=30732 RepID=A0A834C3L4_ORYME|nr:AP-3 complex subunit delta-1 [Oryzias melastigma]
MSDQYVKLEEERRQKERAEKKKKEKKKRKEKRSGRGKKHDSGPESEEDITPAHMVDIVTEEMPENALPSDEDDKDPNDPHKALDIDLDKPLADSEKLPVRSHRAAEALKSPVEDAEAENAGPQESKKKSSKDKKEKKKDKDRKKSKEEKKKKKHKHEEKEEDLLGGEADEPVGQSEEPSEVAAPPTSTTAEEAPTVAAAAAAAATPTTPTAPSVTAPVSEPDEPKDAEMEETKSSKHKKKKQKKEKEEKEKKKKKKHHHHHHHHSDGGVEESVQNGTVEEDEPLPPMSNYCLLAENAYIKMVCDIQGNLQDGSQVVVSVIFENKCSSFLKSMEFNVLDSLNSKLQRPEGSGPHDGLTVPFQLPPGVSNEARFVFTVQSIVMPQKLKGTLTFIVKNEDSSTHEKLDFKLHFTCTSYLITTPCYSDAFAKLLESGDLKSSSIRLEGVNMPFHHLLARICFHHHFSVVERIDSCASMYSRSIQGHHVCLLVKTSAQTVSIDAKCDEPTLLGNVLDEIKQTFSQC